MTTAAACVKVIAAPQWSGGAKKRPLRAAFPGQKLTLGDPTWTRRLKPIPMTTTTIRREEYDLGAKRIW